MQIPAAKKIVNRGFKLIVTDRNGDCLCSKYADEVVAVDTFDVPGNIEAAKKLQEKYDIQAVMTAAADCHETVALMARHLGLHGINPEISRICRNKNLGREVLSKAGIYQPKFSTAETLAEARSFIQGLGGQGAIKATNSSGSRGFSLIRNLDELTQEVFDRALEAGTTKYVVVEEILRPIENGIAEQSVETIWQDGKMYWLNWVDRLFRKDFLFFKGIQGGAYGDLNPGVEIGHINPALHPIELKTQIADMIYKAGLAIGMGHEKGAHVLKADIMLTDKGPCILELTPRLSGGWDSSGSTPLRGADFVNGAISLALGERLDIDLWHKYFAYQNPSLFTSVMAQVSPGAKDCIGREFAIGSSFDRQEAVQNAINQLQRKNYVVPMDQ